MADMPCVGSAAGPGTNTVPSLPLPAVCPARWCCVDFAISDKMPSRTLLTGQRGTTLSQTFLPCLLEPVLVAPSQGSKLGESGQADSRVPILGAHGQADRVSVPGGHQGGSGADLPVSLHCWEEGI